MSLDQGKATGSPTAEIVTPASPLPWTWHAKSKDQAHNGSIYRLERPGHAYAIAMQPQYVEDKQFNADAAFIVHAVNSHGALAQALLDAEAVITGTYKNGEYDLLLSRIRCALAAAKGEGK